MYFVILDAVYLNWEAAWVADCQLLLDCKVRYDGIELHYGSTELQTRFDAFTTT